MRIIFKWNELLQKRIQIFHFLILLIVLSSCKKLVDIDPPTSSITTTQVFADSADANSAILGIYSQLYQGPNILCGFETIYSGMSADELLPFNSIGDRFSVNTLDVGNTTINGQWSNAYSILYKANASIEGLQSSKGISQNAKDQFIGEAKFIRAFVYFYLVNLFGDVPYITSSDYKVNALASRTLGGQVYDSIVADLKYAKSVLSRDYSYSGGERVRATYQSATALLARVYLYLNDWANATAATSEVINDSNFKLASDLNKIFLANSSEAILQWRLDANYASYNANYEGMSIIPYDSTNPPGYYLTKQLLNSFELGDNRKIAWIDSSTYNAVVYYYPYKYKTGPAQRRPGVAPTEYYMVLRLAEQYLIRAEAEVNGGNGDLSNAINDLNVIRKRAGLSKYSGVVDKTSVINAIMHERRIELLAEFGHRWLDIKRTGEVDSILVSIKPQWKSYQQLYPIPSSEIQTDPNLTQNQGYH